jgi:death-on-curing protein
MSDEPNLEPEWVRDDVVVAIHTRQIAEHGGSDGTRDAGLLSSALARPKNLMAYSEPVPDIAALSAAYAFGIAPKQPFIDGNKPTALVVCRTFLLVNGWDFSATQTEKYRTFLSLAAGELSEEELANWIRERLHRDTG